MKKNTIIYIVVAAIIAVGLIWWLTQTQTVSNTSTSQNQNNNTSTDQTSNQNQNNTDNTTNGTTVTKPSYAAALQTYAESRIQFDQKCMVIPNYVTFKAGTTVMFDNRSNRNIAVSLDNAQYTINAYDFMLLPLIAKSSLPYTISVDCGKGENQGQILLQK